MKKKLTAAILSVVMLLMSGSVFAAGTETAEESKYSGEYGAFEQMAVVFGGREAVTHFNVLERFGQYTLVECILETGRTHQIRVHMASIGHSIVGDPLYGIKKEKFNLNGQLLHAKTIGFVHPRTGKMMEFTSDIPEYFENVLEKLRKR